MEFRFKNGAMLFWRVGNMNSNKQKHIGNRAPTSRGIWAFPWPYHEYFYVSHKYDLALPKKYKQADFAGMSEEEYLVYLSKISQIQKSIKPKTFWYSGPIYSRIGPKHIDPQGWYYWESLRDWAKKANGTIKVNMRWRDELYMGRCSYDHLEVFIPNY